MFRRNVRFFTLFLRDLPILLGERLKKLEEGAERWGDNIMSVRSWMVNKKGFEAKQVRLYHLSYGCILPVLLPALTGHTFSHSRNQNELCPLFESHKGKLYVGNYR